MVESGQSDVSDPLVDFFRNFVGQADQDIAPLRRLCGGINGKSHEFAADPQRILVHQEADARPEFGNEPGGGDRRSKQPQGSAHRQSSGMIANGGQPLQIASNKIEDRGLRKPVLREGATRQLFRHHR